MGPRSNSQRGYPASLHSVLTREGSTNSIFYRDKAGTHICQPDQTQDNRECSGCPGELEQRHPPRNMQSQSIWGNLVLQVEHFQLASGQLPTWDCLNIKSFLTALMAPEELASGLPWLLTETHHWCTSHSYAISLCFSVGLLDKSSPMVELMFCSSCVVPAT